MSDKIFQAEASRKARCGGTWRVLLSDRDIRQWTPLFAYPGGKFQTLPVDTQSHLVKTQVPCFHVKHSFFH